MKKIGSMVLKNEYILWEENGKYFVESVKGDRRIVERVDKGDINMAYELTKKKTVSVEEFKKMVLKNKFTFPADIYKTYKVRYLCQRLLICLVCLRKATYRREGKRYLYTVL